MSTEPSETHQFRARDGLYYDSYEKMRDANVRMNQQKLKEMGLDQPSWKKENRRPSLPNNTVSKRKKSVTPSSGSVEPLRRSERTPRQVSLLSPSYLLSGSAECYVCITNTNSIQYTA